jgi:hypothetical protein
LDLTPISKFNSAKRLTIKNILSLCTILLSLLGAFVLSIESYLNLKGRSICNTPACEVVGTYLSIPESALVTIGAAIFSLLFLLLFFTKRYHRYPLLPLLLLIPAMSFDGALIGYQVFTIKEYCALCFGIAALLTTIIIFYCLAHRLFLILIISVFVWVSSFCATAIIDPPPPSGVFHQMAFLDARGIQSDKIDKPTVTLIFSMECPHCIDLISFIGQSDYTAVNWRLASTDLDKQSINKINTFLDELSPGINIFKQLQMTKERISLSPSVDDGKTILSKNKKTHSFMANIGISSIPLVVIETPDNRKEIIWGSEMAKKHLQLYFNKYAK